MKSLAGALGGRRVAVLTGAGVSTGSGIPDYRGPGGSLKRRKPMSFAEFRGSEDNRRRYWARSAAGWRLIDESVPNAAHYAVVRLEEAGIVGGLITQNVDRLHHRAGSRGVIELHGGLDRVVCMRCAGVYGRAAVQEWIETANPRRGDGGAESAPDGDALLDERLEAEFVVPPCPECGGAIKPDVVFFGENVPKERVEASYAAVEESDALLVLGSSLTVYSGFRFADYAVKRGKFLGIVNRGPTRADGLGGMKVEEDLVSAVPLLAGLLIGDGMESVQSGRIQEFEGLVNGDGGNERRE